MKKAKVIFSNVFRYFYLTAIGFTILYPLLMLLSTSGKDLYGLVDPLVRWIPTSFEWKNYARAFEAIGGLGVMLKSFGYILLVSLIQTMMSAIIGYGFSKARFRGHNILFVLMLLVFFIPDQVMFLPRYVMISNYKILGTLWTIILPTLFGQGIKSSLMILVFWLFYQQQPKVLEEAAFIDGASVMKTFFKINLPLAKSGFIITFVLSFAFNWNDTYFSEIYFKDKIQTSNLLLQQVRETYTATYGATASAGMDAYFNSGIEAAAALLIIAPLVILYILLERKMMDSIDKAGIAGE